MPFVELRSYFGDRTVRILSPNSVIEGNIDRVHTTVEIVDYDRLTVNNVVYEKGEGGVVFDKEGWWGFQQRLIAYLTKDQAIDLATNQQLAAGDIVAPGAFQNSLESVERLAKIQAGDEKAARWTVGRVFGALTSLGTTERYTQDPTDES